MSRLTNKASSVCRVLAAEPEAVFDAFVHPDALAAWLAPGGMTAVVHNFDGRVGGGYEMSLYYPSADRDHSGKTAEAEDRYTARYTVLDRPHRVVAKITFHTMNAAFAGEMTMDVTLRRQDGGTEVCIVFENLPAGVRPEDNDEGTRSSLQKLARYLE